MFLYFPVLVLHVFSTIRTCDCYKSCYLQDNYPLPCLIKLLSLFFFFLSVLSSCLSHPCLHGGTCIDTYFLHSNLETLNMYSNPAVIDSQENGLAYICKCVAPYAGHNCEGTPPRNSNPKPYLEMPLHSLN